MHIHEMVSPTVLMTQLAQGAVIIVLALRRLAGEFKIFFAFLCANVLRWIALTEWGGSNFSSTYRTIWVVSEPLILILQLLVVLEFYRLLYRAYPGIQGFARVLIIVAALLACVVTFGTVEVDVGRVGKLQWLALDAQRLFVLKRVISSLVGVLLFVTMAFFPKAPSALNVRVHGWLLSAFFIAAAGGFFGINYGLTYAWMSVIFLAIQFCCFVLWAALLRPAFVRLQQPSPEAISRAERWNEDFMILAKWLVR